MKGNPNLSTHLECGETEGTFIDVTQQMSLPDFMINANKIYVSKGLPWKSNICRIEWDELVKKY